MKPPVIERLDHPAAQEPDGWRTIASIQTNGKQLAVQIDEDVPSVLTAEKIDRLVSLLQDALYRLRPDLRKQ